MSKLRYLLQAGFVVFAGYLGLRHQIVGGGPRGAGPIDAFCPFGAFEALPTLLAEGIFVSKTSVSNLWILAALVLGILIVGPVFCGWICPLGSLSEWIYSLRKRFIATKLEPATTKARLLTWGRPFLLVLILFMSWQTKSIWFEGFDPYKAIFHMSVENFVAASIIAGFVIMSLVVERSWCRWLCPLGIINGTIGRFSLFKIRRNSQSCIACGACSRACPAGIAVAKVSEVSDDRCIGCHRCVASCPVSNTLAIQAPVSAGSRVLKPIMAGLIAVVVFFGVIGTAQVSGHWRSNDARPVAQISSPAELRGYMKWDEVVSHFKVDETSLARELKLPIGFNRKASLKDLGHANGFETKEVGAAIEKLKKQK